MEGYLIGNIKNGVTDDMDGWSYKIECIVNSRDHCTYMYIDVCILSCIATNIHRTTPGKRANLYQIPNKLSKDHQETVNLSIRIHLASPHLLL